MYRGEGESESGGESESESESVGESESECGGEMANVDTTLCQGARKIKLFCEHN